MGISRRDTPQVDRDRSSAADTFDFSRLQDPQKSNLSFRRKFPDFIEKNRPSFGELKPANTLVKSAGESAFFVTKQFRGDQGLGNRRTGHFNKRPLGTERPFMNGSRNQFFSGSRFPGN